jgi:hypothetical protein
MMILTMRFAVIVAKIPMAIVMIVIAVRDAVIAPKMISYLVKNATVVHSISMIAIAVMTVAIVGILMQVYAWQTLMKQRLKSN